MRVSDGVITVGEPKDDDLEDVATSQPDEVSINNNKRLFSLCNHSSLCLLYYE